MKCLFWLVNPLFLIVKSLVLVKYHHDLPPLNLLFVIMLHVPY